MVEIHWILILLIASISGFGGLLLSAILTMAKRSDEALAQMWCPKCQHMWEPYNRTMEEWSEENK